jgi:hypothetical protein
MITVQVTPAGLTVLETRNVPGLGLQVGVDQMEVD